MRLAVPQGLVRIGRNGIPSLPAGLRIYAIGDIHGRVDLLNICLEQIDSDLATLPAPNVLHVFLGDYIDRGPSSRQVVDRLIERNATHTCAFLRGNHELMALRCLRDLREMPGWLRLGGLETLASYGLSPTMCQTREQFANLQQRFQEALPPAHFKFFGDLADSFGSGDFFFAHAGVRPGVPLDQQKTKDLLWIRDEFLSSKADYGKIIVHGHTPVAQVDVRANRINVDTGAYASNRLSCLILEDQDIKAFEASAEPIS
jgi:serine/threonine protein phosphatase 1